MWNIRDIDEEQVSLKYGVSSLCAKVLASSSFNEEEIKEILAGDDHLSVSQDECVRQACERILLARERKEKVFVAGDYDADGITATAIMKATLDALGITNGYYIPDRFREGYGLSANTVRMVHEKGYAMIITVDNGVKAHEALAEANDLGLYTIVTDHHKIDEEIKADLVVHPDYMSEQFRFLSGAGVALEISRCLIGNREDLNTLAGIASIGDIMPYWSETRKLVKRACRVLQTSNQLPVSSLLHYASEINEKTIAFQIVPKLNSVGRMNDISNVNTLPRFLLLKDRNSIASFAQQLEKVNDTRKSVSSRQYEIARKMINDDPIQILFAEDFHEGVCGLIAGKIANEIHQPVLVMAKNGDLIKGSGRSVEGFDMFSFFQECPYLYAFGGHEQAVGLSVHSDDFEAFKEDTIQRMKALGFVMQESTKDAILINVDEISFDTVNDLNILMPYPTVKKDGTKVSEMFFALKDFKIIDYRDMGKIVKYRIENRYGGFEAIVYKSKNIEILKNPDTLIGTLGVNRWKNTITCQFIVESMQ